MSEGDPKHSPEKRTWTQRDFVAFMRELCGDSFIENQTEKEDAKDDGMIKFEVRFYQHASPPPKKLKRMRPAPREHWCDRFLRWLLQPLDF